jgi:hypothetical protein
VARRDPPGDAAKSLRDFDADLYFPWMRWCASCSRSINPVHQGSRQVNGQMLEAVAAAACRIHAVPRALADPPQKPRGCSSAATTTSRAQCGRELKIETSGGATKATSTNVSSRQGSMPLRAPRRR